MLTVKGVQRKFGTFEGNAYDNFYLHCLSDSPRVPTIGGEVCEIIKVKAGQLASVLDGVIKSDDDWRSLIDCKVRAFYDQYGNATLIQLVDSPSKK